MVTKGHKIFIYTYIQIHIHAYIYIYVHILSKNKKIESPWLQKDIKLTMFHCLRKFVT